MSRLHAVLLINTQEFRIYDATCFCSFVVTRSQVAASLCAIGASGSHMVVVFGQGTSLHKGNLFVPPIALFGTSGVFSPTRTSRFIESLYRVVTERP